MHCPPPTHFGDAIDRLQSGTRRRLTASGSVLPARTSLRLKKPVHFMGIRLRPLPPPLLRRSRPSRTLPPATPKPNQRRCGTSRRCFPRPEEPRRWHAAFRVVRGKAGSPSVRSRTRTALRGGKEEEETREQEVGKCAFDLYLRSGASLYIHPDGSDRRKRERADPHLSCKGAVARVSFRLIICAELLAGGGVETYLQMWQC